jgi:hypothetical protein
MLIVPTTKTMAISLLKKQQTFCYQNITKNIWHASKNNMYTYIYKENELLVGVLEH